VVALSKALDEANVAISVVIVWGSEHALGSFSFFEHLSFQIVPANAFNASHHYNTPGKSE
jgi:hypothetical protein